MHLSHDSIERINVKTKLFESSDYESFYELFYRGGVGSSDDVKFK